MIIALEVFALLTSITFMFVFIWGFIILNQIFGQLRYKNYLMEKLIQAINFQRKDEIKKQDCSCTDAGSNQVTQQEAV